MTLPPRLAAINPETDHLQVVWHEPGVVEVVLSNPQRRNAMSDPMTRAWETAMVELDRLPGLRAVLVRGEGSAFCAGGDLSWLGEDGQAEVGHLMDKMRTFYRRWLAVRELRVPTVAALNGPAVGAGAAVALACDIRWAATGATFSVPFTRLGLHPGMATTYLLPDVVGPAMAKDLLFTGRSLDAAGMLAAGVVTDVIEQDFAAEALRRTVAIAETAPLATRLTKQAFRPAPAADLEAALAWEELAQPVTMTTEDLREGLQAAGQRRRPRFVGH